MKVMVRGNNVDGALKVLKRKVKESNLLVAVREKDFYDKPCQKRKKAKKSAILRERKRQEQAKK